MNEVINFKFWILTLMKEDIENLIKSATMNANEDRAATKMLLTNIMKYISTAEERHREVGLVAAKYLETLQRSNEQLVKIATLLQKKENNKDTSISDEEKDELFDLINGEVES
jgi:hypothetical protein